jgi:type I restriction enzyme S subunit
MKLGEFVTLQRGHDLPDSQRRPGPVPVLGSFGITGHHDTPKARGPGVTVGRSGASFGVVTYSAVDYWPLNTALYVIDFHGNDQRFAYYFLKCLDFRRYNSGSAQPSLNRNYIHPIPVVVPPVPEQQVIAHILGSLDDKIELNQRMNETLEAIARAIFKSWFVGFDPVRAKAEGRDPPAMDDETAALFPDAFEDSPLGRIPKGWKVQRLGDVVGINERSIARGYPHKTIEYVDISAVSVGRLDSTVQHDLSSSPSRARRLVSDGDTIWSCVRPNRKSYLFIDHPVPNLVVSTGFAVLTPKEIPPSYLHAWVTTDAFVEYLSYSADGSAYPAVRADRFSEALMLLPPQRLLDKFDAMAGPIRRKIAANGRESRTLTAIRDALLPKLISGEHRIPDAEKLVKTTE